MWLCQACPDTSIPYDVFMVAGQSNAQGHGNAEQSVDTPGPYYQLDGEGNFAPLVDPVGGARTGSAWPAFARTWRERTGHGSIFLEQATGGSALLHEAAGERGDWSDDGLLKARAEDAWSEAHAVLAERGITISGRFVLWSQGEREAQMLDGGIVVADTYRDALVALIGEWVEELDLDAFAVFRTGAPAGDPGNPDWAAIRSAQDAAVAASAKSVMVFRDAVSFASEGGMQDDRHYTQSGYNRMGREGAAALAAHMGH